MKSFDKHEFDEIFRTGLIAPDLSEVDEDWALMKGRLQNQKSRRKVPYYIVFISAIAAVLLLVFSVTFNSADSLPDQTAVNAKADSTSAPALQLPNTLESVGEPTSASSDYSRLSAHSQATNIYYSNFDSKTEVNKPVINAATIEADTVYISNAMDTSTNPAVIAVLAPASEDAGTFVNDDVSAIKKPLSTEDVGGAEDKEEGDVKLSPSKARFSLALNLAPGVNGVEQLQNNKLSYSLGAGLIYNISNKLSIEAGAAYGRKTYQTGFSSFRPASYNLFQVKPNIVSSGFDVMDIQLNLAYTVLNKGKSSIGIGGGISSYLMLDEQYSFSYQNLNARGLSSFSTGYQNNHFFGIANLSLSYKRSITNNVRLAFNPYLKLPLTDLGYGNIRLRSAGMSVGVITDLKKSKK